MVCRIQVKFFLRGYPAANIMILLQGDFLQRLSIKSDDHEALRVNL